MYEILSRAYDGPIPPAELAAARWGSGAAERLSRAADAELIESCLRATIAALGQLRCRSGGQAQRNATAGLRRLVRSVAEYRCAALACAALPPQTDRAVVPFTR